MSNVSDDPIEELPKPLAKEPKPIPLERLEAALTQLLFDSSDPIVVAMNGCWGEGKTFFWKSFIQRSGLSEEVGYVSVFGASSIRDIRERVVFEAVRHPRWVKRSWPKWVNSVAEKVVAWSELPSSNNYKKDAVSLARWLSRILKNAVTRWPEYIGAFFQPNSLSVQFLEESFLKPQWVLCIDDIERLPKAVDLAALLGYINELRDERRLKVVIIYNHEEVGVEGDTFKLYKEKVIDRQLPFNPKTTDIIDFVFKDTLELSINTELRSELARHCDFLGLRNIRVLFKVQRYYKEFAGSIPEADVELLHDYFFSILLYTWMLYTKQAKSWLTFDAVLKYNEIALMMGDEAKDPDSDESALLDFLNTYRYRITDEIDKVLIDFIQTDVLDVAALLKEYARLSAERNSSSLAERFNSVWTQLYHGTLSDNEGEFCEQLIIATHDFLPFIPISSLDAALEKLAQFNRADSGQRLLNQFIQLRGHTFMPSTRDSLVSPIKYPQLKEFVEKASALIDDDRPLGDVITEFTENRFLSQRNKERLNHFSKDELVEYFTTTDMPTLTSTLRSLQREGLEIIYGVAEDISEINRMNYRRMESMGLLRDSDDQHGNSGSDSTTS